MPVLESVYTHSNGFYYFNDNGYGVNVSNSGIFESQNSFDKLENVVNITDKLKSFIGAPYRIIGENLVFGNRTQIDIIRKGSNITLDAFDKGRCIYSNTIESKSKLMKWKEKYQGTFITMCINGLDSYKNPLEDLDCVYSEGVYIETYPMHLHITIPESHKKIVENEAKQRNISYCYH